ncbi:MAG: DnaJ domain-containing protein [candidate division WOR-3 bacterium]
MQVEKDYYAILGLSKSATAEEIKKAYRHLVRRYHPDAGADEEEAAHFHEIQEAYDVLSDPEQREAYDRWREMEGLDQRPALILKATPSYQTLSCLSEEQAFYVLLEIMASPEIRDTRPLLNLCLVLDRSTSMQGERLQKAKEAAMYIIDRLGEDDTFSLVVFSDRAEILLPGRRRLNKAMAKSVVSTIGSWGGTEILQGLLAGLSEIEKNRLPNSINHLILLTDGQTYGDEKGCLEQAELARQRQISITTLGLGTDWNDELLDQIAARSGGTSAYIDSPAKIMEVFRDRIHSLGSVLARELTLTLRLGKEVKVREVFRVSPYITRLEEREGVFPLGLLESHKGDVFLIEMLIPPHPAGQHRLVRAEVVGDIPALGRQRERAWQEIVVNFAEGPIPDQQVPSAIVGALGKLAIFKMQEKALSDLEQGKTDLATQRLEAMATRLINIGEIELARAALLEAGRIAKTGQLSPEGKKKIKYGTRSLSILPREVRHD